ncbi:helix-turn-helix-domain containing protein type [Grosmannia clavigera kw1407]|uniref:Helix-turn-helix-domain containing protein type n=1 Tax=Grosmannia clavigera (strain kw1407 / UAMH 11150) TaxID=655863 RepID=F0XG54_GROCL|nr:helix-turn-helix-domain containing protein type [Grosmannia clavigera kw1407]EFX03387.1 helix-turn-helix-domain containing protein type [Grosmannia clavigera kw1407]
MPAITLYDISITTFLKSLKTLNHILEKAESHAKGCGKDPDAYATVALTVDMKPLSFQVQVVSNTIKKSVWRLTGIDPGNWPDDESTIMGLKARVKKTAELLQKIDPKSLEGKDDTMVELQRMQFYALTVSPLENQTILGDS